LSEGFEILGAPVVNLDVSVDRPVALLAVRLNEIEPDGTSKRIAFGVLNLTHRESDEFPQALEPGKRYRVRVPLHDCAHGFKASNRLRVAVSTTYWPAFWPSPEAVTLTLYAGQSELELPERPPRAEDAKLERFGSAFVPKNSGSTIVSESRPSPVTREWDVTAKKLTIRTDLGEVRTRLNATGTEIFSSGKETSEIVEDDPTSVKVEWRSAAAYSRGVWNAKVSDVLRFTLTRNEFLLHAELHAFDGDTEIFSKVWDRRTPRQLV
jgi:hypothetical protein